MPDEASMNKDFFKAVLAGQKQLLKKQEVSYITVPHYDELSVKALWPELKKDGEFMQFFPAEYPKGRGPPREYFYNVLNTLKPEYLQQHQYQWLLRLGISSRCILQRPPRPRQSTIRM